MNARQCIMRQEIITLKLKEVYAHRPMKEDTVKDRQQVITAVLPRSQLNSHCEFAPKPLYYYHI